MWKNTFLGDLLKYNEKLMLKLKLRLKIEANFYILASIFSMIFNF